jgi:phosphoribosylformylglycinamidine synthase
VSLYNETAGTDIDPTPVVATLGLIDRLRPGIPTPALSPGGVVVLLGPNGPAATSLAGSRWEAQHRDHRPPHGQLAPLDLDLHRRLLDLVAGLVDARLVEGIHDVSDGGLALALTEMAVKGGTGCRVSGVSSLEELFGEGPSRVLLCVAPPHLAEVVARAGAAGVATRQLGAGGGDRLVVEALLDLPMAEVVAAWENALPAALSAP